MFRGVRPMESVTFTLWSDAEGSASSKAEECSFLQREVKVMRFWSSFNRDREHLPTVVCANNMWNWTYFLNRRHNCLIAGFLCCVRSGMALSCYTGWGSAGYGPWPYGPILCMVPDPGHSSSVVGKKYCEFIAGLWESLPEAVTSSVLLWFLLFHSSCPSRLPGCCSMAATLWKSQNGHTFLGLSCSPDECVHFREKQFCRGFVFRAWKNQGEL